MGATQLTALRSLSQPVILAGQLYAAQSYVDDIANDYQTDLISIVNQTATTLATNISQLTATEHALFYQQAGQIYRRTGDGQATQLTQTSHKIVSFAPAPDGTKIVFAVLVSDAEAFNTVSDRPQVRRYTKRRYKADGVGFIDEQRHFEVYEATIAGETRRLLTTDLPVQVADTIGERALLIAQTTTEDADELRSALQWLDLETGAITPLTTEVAEVHEATIAPDGRQVLFIANDAQYPNRRVASLYRFDGEATTIAFDQEELLEGPNSDIVVQNQARHVRWLDDDTWLFETGFHGHTRVYQGSATTNQLLLDTPQYLQDFAISKGTVILAQQDTAHPSQLLALDLATKATQIVFDANATLQFPRAEKYVFSSEDGSPVDGWFLAAQSEGPAPVVLYVHGGPHGAYGDAFFWEFQRFTEAGYNVVFTNPHGSTTYGQDFINAVVNHYGEQDFRDVIAGLDVALQRFGEYIDANQQIIIGGSYGGFMTTWAIGHTSRFEAAISQRPVTEWLHLTGASDIGYNFVQDEMGANPYTPAGREELIKRSPITYAAQVKTPLLMLHGEYDLRTPIAQTEMYYTAIKILTDTPVEMVRFPQAWHGVSRNGLPNLRETRLTVMFDWLQKTLA